MSLEICTLCKKKFLTESDPYLIFPHSTGYYAFCLSCVAEDDVREYNTLLRVIKQEAEKRRTENTHG